MEFYFLLNCNPVWYHGFLMGPGCVYLIYSCRELGQWQSCPLQHVFNLAMGSNIQLRARDKMQNPTSYLSTLAQKWQRSLPLIFYLRKLVTWPLLTANRYGKVDLNWCYIYQLCPSKTHVVIWSNVVALGSGAFGKWLGHWSFALMSR
jgi:hypothetical protein